MRPIAAVLLLALVGVACSGADPVVATVNGRDIHQSEVLELRSVDPDAVRVDSSEFRNELFNVIAQEVVVSALDEDFGVTVTPDEVEAELAARLEEGGITEEEAIASLQDPAATRERLLRIVYSGLLGERATAALASRDDFVAEITSDTPELVTTVCARHILTETEAEAQAAAERLAAGEDFAAVADEVSTDPAAGGDLGCSVAGRFVTEFAEATLVAPLGKVFGPVETEFGFHLIVVDSREQPDAEAIAADPLAALPADLLQSEFNNWFNDQVDEAEVSVLSRVGTWFPDGPGILPPG